MSETGQPRRPASNRRVSRRQAVRSTTRIECRLGNMGLGANILRSVQDLSETGIRATMQAALAVGQEVELVFNGVSGGKQLKRRATVVWAQPEGEKCCRTGLRFDSPLPYSVLTQLTRAGG